MKLTLGFSPCPNDTFIFDALINGKIDTEGLEFDYQTEDVETLNQMGFRKELDITKMSFHAYLHLSKEYTILDSGSALGYGVGPLLISKMPLEEGQTHRPSMVNTAQHCGQMEPSAVRIAERLAKSVNNSIIGIPGKYTTANFLCSIAFPQAQQKQELLFSDIEPKLLAEDIDLGVIIHENRFTFQQKGLHKAIDLGSYWEALTGCAIPLGGIFVREGLPLEIKQKVNRVMRKSIEFAFHQPHSSADFVKKHAQEMEEKIIYQHITTYVNKFTLALGLEGKKAVRTMFNIAAKRGLINESVNPLFL